MTRLRTGAAALIACILLAALSAPVWSRQTYEQQFRSDADAAPSHRFILGTDALGRDRLVRLAYGTRTSLLLAPLAALLTCLEAAVIGGAAGFLGGAARSALMSQPTCSSPCRCCFC